MLFGEKTLNRETPKKYVVQFSLFWLCCCLCRGFFRCCAFFSPPQPTSNLHTNSPAQLKHFPIFALPERVFIVCRGISLSVNSGEKQLELLPCDSTSHTVSSKFLKIFQFLSLSFSGRAFEPFHTESD